jgi:hypothetical protein
MCISPPLFLCTIYFLGRRHYYLPFSEEETEGQGYWIAYPGTVSFGQHCCSALLTPKVSDCSATSDQRPCLTPNAQGAESLEKWQDVLSSWVQGGSNPYYLTVSGRNRKGAYVYICMGADKAGSHDQGWVHSTSSWHMGQVHTLGLSLAEAQREPWSHSDPAEGRCLLCVQSRLAGDRSQRTAFCGQDVGPRLPADRWVSKLCSGPS